METETITYENYTFNFNVTKNQIKVNMTDNTLMEIYEGIVKEDDIYVKPIKKFYSMIIKSLNNEQFYTFSISTQKSIMVCKISYNTEMIDIEEYINLNKISASESKEQILIKRVKELEDMLTPVFGYKYDDEVGLKYIKFDLNTPVLDFRPFNQLLTESGHLDSYKMNELFITEFNKFKNVKEIIFDAILSPVYCNPNFSIKSDSYYSDYENTKYTFYNIQCEHMHSSHNGYQNKPKNTFLFDNEQIYLPSVTEIKIYILPETKKIILKKIENNRGMYSSNYSPEQILSEYNFYLFQNLRSLPNLKKIHIINTSGKQINCGIRTLIIKEPSYSEQKAICYGWKKNLKHIILKNINVSQEETNLITSRNIKLEYIS